MSDFYVLVTDAGAELEAAAHAAGVSVGLSEFGVCDGGVDFIPDPTLTAFANEVYHGPISSLKVNADDPAEIVAQCIIPADSGGYTIRGVAIYASDGTLYAVGNYAAQDKPSPDSGFAVSLEILVMLALSATTDVTLEVTDTAYLTEAQANTLYLRQDKHLDEIAAEGSEAQQEARGNLALGTVATYDITTSNKDLTPGRVMKVGDYGLGVANGSAPYLNSIYDIKCSGEYNALGDGTSTPTTGVPSGSGNTRFAVSAGNIYPNQYLVTLTGNVHFYVGVVDTENKTSTWSTFYNTLNKPSANDVGAIPAAIVGSISNNGSMANAKINGWWQVSVSDPKTVPGFPKYANGTYLYGYGYMFVWIQGNTWFQLFYGHHGANATRQNWTADPDTATDWIVTYNEANPPPATDLSTYMKTADANARFITGIRMANYATNGSEGLSDSAHRVMTGIWASNGWDNPSTQSSRQAQFQVAGSWYNAAYV